jgi:hypothetical protein
MADEATDELSEFFDYIWGTDSPTGRPVYVYLPVKHESFVDPEKNPVGWKKFMFSWPRQRAAVIKHVLKYTALGGDVFYSPALFSAGRPVKENVAGTYFLWVDFDGNAPENWPGPVPEPTLIIQSSLPGHQHCYWRLDHFIEDSEVIEERNASLAYLLSADTSGWDADQVLRPPHTMNYKRMEPVVVKAWAR